MCSIGTHLHEERDALNGTYHAKQDFLCSFLKIFESIYNHFAHRNLKGTVAEMAI